MVLMLIVVIGRITV